MPDSHSKYLIEYIDKAALVEHLEKVLKATKYDHTNDEEKQAAIEQVELYIKKVKEAAELTKENLYKIYRIFLRLIQLKNM